MAQGRRQHRGRQHHSGLLLRTKWGCLTVPAHPRPHASLAVLEGALASGGRPSCPPPPPPLRLLEAPARSTLRERGRRLNALTERRRGHTMRLVHLPRTLLALVLVLGLCGCLAPSQRLMPQLQRVAVRAVQVKTAPHWLQLRLQRAWCLPGSRLLRFRGAVGFSSSSGRNNALLQIPSSEIRMLFVCCSLISFVC